MTAVTSNQEALAFYQIILMKLESTYRLWLSTTQAIMAEAEKRFIAPEEVKAFLQHLSEWDAVLTTYEPSSQYFQNFGLLTLSHRLAAIRTDLREATPIHRQTYEMMIAGQARRGEITASVRQTWIDTLEEARKVSATTLRSV